MKKTVCPPFVASLLALLFAALTLSACGSTAQPAATAVPPTATASSSSNPDGLLQDARPTVEKSETGNMVPPSGLPIIEVAEASSPRDALSQELGKITWIDAVQGDAQDSQSAQEKALDAIKSEGARLAAVDYVPLSLEAYREVTGKLLLTGDDFQTGEIRLEYIGRSGGSPRYLLYSFRGKDIPQRPDRPQVYRWVQPYALYDNTTLNVVKLVATVHGEVHE